MESHRVVPREPIPTIPVNQCVLYPVAPSRHVHRRRLFRRGPADPPGFDPSGVPSEPTDARLEWNGHGYDCLVVRSTDDGWTLAFGRRDDGVESRVFRCRDGEIVDTFPASRPVDGAIATDGTAVLTDDGDPTALDGTLEVIGSSGVVRSRDFDSNLGRPAIEPGGDLVAVVTRTPEPTVVGIDSRNGETVFERSIQNRNARLLGFHSADGGSLLYVGVRPTADPFLALDTDGEVVWGSERYWLTRPLSERFGGLVDRLPTRGK